MLSLSSQFLQYFSGKSDVGDVFLVNFSGIANGKFVSGKRGMFGYRPCVASVSHWAGSLDPLNCKSELSTFEVVFADDGPIRDLITANSVIGKTLIVTLGADPGNDTDFPESAFAPYFGANGGTGGAIISGVTFEPGFIRVQTRDPRSVGFSRNGLAITVPNAAGLPGFAPGGAAVLAMRQLLQAGLVSPALYDATGFSLASNPAIAHLVVDRLRRSQWTATQTHGAHTMLALSMNGLILPQATINVYGNDGFPSSGTLIVQSSGGLQAVAYTGLGANSFTGCSGGAGTLSTGSVVSNSIDNSPATSDRSVHDPASLQTLLDEIAIIARGYVLVLEDGLIRFKAFDAAAAAVDRFTAADIIPESVSGGVDDEKVVHSVLISSAWEGISGGAGGAGYHFQYLDQDLAALGTWSFSDGLNVLADKKLNDQWFSTLGAGDKAVLVADTTITMWSDNFTGLPANVPASAAVDASHPGYVFIRGGTTAAGGAMTAGEIVKYTSVTPGAAINNTTNYSVLGGLTRGMFGTTAASHYPAFPTGTVTAESSIAHVTIVDITAIVRAADEIIKRFKGGAGVLRFKTPMTKYGPQLGDVVNAETPVYIRPGLNGLAVGNVVPFEVSKKETDPSTKICSWELTEIQAPARTPHIPSGAGIIHRASPNTGLEDPLFKNAHLPHSIQSSLAGGLVPNIFVDGSVPAVSGTLTTSIPIQRVLCAIGAIYMPPLNYVFTASKDTYVDLLVADKGQCLWAMTEVANGAAAPALAANRLRAFKIVTSAGAVTGVTDLRNLALVDGGRHIVDLSIIAAKLGAGSVIAGKILPGTIVDADVNAAADINGTKLLNNSIVGGKFTLGQLDIPSAGVKTIGGFWHGAGSTTSKPFAAVLDIATTNFIVNPSFETNTTSWSAIGTATISRLTGLNTPVQRAFAGAWYASLAIPAGATDQGMKHADIACVSTDQIAFSAFLMTSASKNIRLRIEFFTAGLVSLGATTTSDTKVTAAVDKDGWSRVVVVATAPATTAWVRASILNGSTDQGVFTIYADGVQLEKNTSNGGGPSSYCDGDIGPGFAWTGTANASTSTRSGGLHLVAEPSAYTPLLLGSGKSNTGLRSNGGLQVGANGGDDSVVFDVSVGNFPWLKALGNNADVPFKISAQGHSTVLIGQSGSELSIAGAGSGSFPSTPATNDVFFRTDRQILYFYDGTRWLSVEEFALDIAAYKQFPNTIITATTSVVEASALPDAPGSGQLYMTRWVSEVFINGLNDATRFWNVGVGDKAGTNFASYNTNAAPGILGAGWNRIITTVNSVRTGSTDHLWTINCTLSGVTPGGINVVNTIHYRLVG